MTDAACGLPVLYSFRRCPYAMRARLALAAAGIRLELREILLKDKPAPMLDISGKGTVPVLQLPDGQVIDESIDVMRWALAQHDPDHWCEPESELSRQLIADNDGQFKSALDKYKYHVRHPEFPQSHYRAQCEVFLQTLEKQLAQHNGEGLVRASASFADMAIFPFVRQFAGADSKWFAVSNYSLLKQWLNAHVKADHFARIMTKYPLWRSGQPALIVDWQV